MERSTPSNLFNWIVCVDARVVVVVQLRCKWSECGGSGGSGGEGGFQARKKQAEVCVATGGEGGEAGAVEEIPEMSSSVLR